MRRLFTLIALTLAVFTSTACAQQADAPKPRVLIVSIDGLRPDLALRADTPTLHGLLKQGSFTFWAQTTAVSVTLPSHTSMLTGVVPIKHGIEWNVDLDLKEMIYPKYPTLFEVAHAHGFSTGMAAGKSKFRFLNKPGTIDFPYIATSSTSEDPAVAEQAVKIIREHQPEVMFVHFPSVDNVGHAIGWATPQQLQTIHIADACLAQVLDALDAAHLREQTLIIVTADHGGAGRSHGPDDPRSRNIPWIAVGPGVKKDFDLTTYGDLVIHTEDTFATACAWLKLPAAAVNQPIDGKPVDRIFEKAGSDLMHAEGGGAPKM